MANNVRVKTHAEKASAATKVKRDDSRLIRSAGTRNMSINRRGIEVYKNIYWRENNEDDAAYVIRRLAESMK